MEQSLQLYVSRKDGSRSDPWDDNWGVRSISLFSCLKCQECLCSVHLARQENYHSLTLQTAKVNSPHLLYEKVSLSSFQLLLCLMIQYTVSRSTGSMESSWLKFKLLDM
ncbi:UNVERIFIED_CONTAM: hypothetical protein K2H54_048569 [Gekko kuhli]